MHKKIFLKLIIIFVLIAILPFNLCFAIETENIDKVEGSSKKELLLVINECVKEIKQELKEIDKTLSSLDKTEEYEKYPAIRLNIDTPFFGLNSMVDKKLKIKNQVSTVDVARGYSIKSIINNMSIKLPDFEVGNITVSTRDVKLDESISEEDAKACILKLVQYISQIKNTNILLEKRINNIFEGYIPKEKEKRIENINKKIDEISLNILNKDDDILTIKLLNNDENSKKLIDKYYKINNQIYNLKSLTNNVLLNNDQLEKLEKSLNSLELNITSYFKDINTEITRLNSDINIYRLLENTNIDLEKKQKELAEYVEESNKQVSVNFIENEDENTNIETETLNVEKYQVVSKYIIDYENSLLDTLQEKIKYYMPDKNEETSDEVKEISNDEKISVLEDVIKLYKDFISKENKFYLDNLNYILRDTTYKLTKLPEYTNADTIKDVKYIYISLPEEVDDLFNMYNTKSTIQIERMTINLKERLYIIVDSNIKVNEQYIDFNKS